MNRLLVALGSALVTFASAAGALAEPPPAPPAPERPAPAAPFADWGIRAFERPKNVALADLGLHVVGVGYQRTLRPWVAVQASTGLYSPWTQYDEPGDMLGVFLRTRAFFHPLRGAPAGLWISPFAQYGLGSTKDGNERRLSAIWGVGASAGWSLLLGQRVLIAIGGGAQYHSVDPLGVTGKPGFAKLGPTLDGNLGYAF